MSQTIPAALFRATALTRAGRLSEATRLIQETLSGVPAGEASERAAPAKTALLLPDLTATRGPAVAEAPPPRPDSPFRPAPRVPRPLGQTVRDLAEWRKSLGEMPLARPARSTPPTIPAGAQYLSRTFACAAGARAYRLYVPASLEGRPRGLVLMLHGCKQNPDDFAVGTRMNEKAQAAGLLVVYPEQPSAVNPMSCWNWFDPAHQDRDRGEPAILAGLAEAVAAEFDVPRTHVFVAGLSAGGAMAAILADVYPEVFAAAGVHSGLAAGAARDVPSAFAAMNGSAGAARPAPRRGSAGAARLIVFHGTADRTVHPSNGEAILSGRGTGGAPADAPQRGTSPDGRAYTRIVHRRPDGIAELEHWSIEGAGHAWSGGDRAGSFADPVGPDASDEMVRFFLDGAGPA
ncbi:extracellular catalytic domain type 1 short-chain-length polyhydroxyalkanoate depolymerase [Prosthecomicrobium sp. N25]|uniref:extracellular catalytic domain type 1 short-chain-length polyhydroxyalkanoate depolymerase n=1 Tax=Prosthecomicrobium sp. N25 TaxID=3129254 RepID=UPI003077A375